MLRAEESPQPSHIRALIQPSVLFPLHTGREKPTAISPRLIAKSEQNLYILSLSLSPLPWRSLCGGARGETLLASLSLSGAAVSRPRPPLSAGFASRLRNALSSQCRSVRVYICISIYDANFALVVLGNAWLKDLFRRR